MATCTDSEVHGHGVKCFKQYVSDEESVIRDLMFLRMSTALRRFGVRIQSITILRHQEKVVSSWKTRDEHFL